MKIVEREIKGRKGCDKRHDVSCRMPHRASGLTSRAPWPKVKLGEIGRVAMCKRVLNRETADTGEIPFFKIGTFGKKANAFITRDKFEYYRTHYSYPKKGNVLISAAGTIGRLVVFNGESAYFQDSNIVWLEHDGQRLCDKYLYYFLLGHEWQFTQGATIQRLYNDDVRNTEIPLPPLPVQRRIADILSAYDDLIENNRRRIAILEETARLTYRKWFGGVEQCGTATLGEIAPFVRGKVITLKNAVHGKVPVVAGGLEPAYFHNVANTGAPVITISGSGANAGFTRMYFEPIWASDCSWCDKSKTKCFYFAYCFLKDNADALRNLQQGAAQPHVYPKDINALEVALPKSDDLLDDFEEVVEPMFSQCGVLAKQNVALAAARDMLLPRLMNNSKKEN